MHVLYDQMKKIFS